MKRIIAELEDDEYEMLVDILGHSDGGRDGWQTFNSLYAKILSQN